MWQAIVREPFLQLLVLGAALFGLYRSALPERAEDAGVVLVNQALVDSIRERFKAELRRPPSRDELVKEVQGEVRRELLYREGQALGLDRDDVIKRRVAEKVEFLAGDLARTPPIDDRAVREAYERAGQRYVRPRQVSLRQLLFTAENPKLAADRAHEAYARLKAGAVDFEAARARATPTLLPTTLDRADAGELARSYGSDFAQRAMRATKPGWLLPFESGFGIHLVEITQVLPSGPLPFDEARQDIRLELEHQRRERSIQELYERVRAKYEIRTEDVNLPELEQVL